MKLFHIIGGMYKHIPTEIQNIWKNACPSLSYNIIDEPTALDFLCNHYNSELADAFRTGNTKWKADLLRFCLMSKFAGVYSDVDQSPGPSWLELPPPGADTVTVIGAHSPPSSGISPLPKGELHIGLIQCRTPDPIFMEYVHEMTPTVVASGEPYAINIQGLYSYLCRRWNIDEIIPHTRYVDPHNGRAYLFLKEVHTKDGYQILNEKDELVMHSPVSDTESPRS